MRPEALTTLGLKVGDAIVIGQSTFTIRGVVTSEPGAGMGQFNLGPRVFVDFADVPATGLLGFGSRATRQVLVKVPEERIDTLVSLLRVELRDEFAGVRSYRSNEDQIGRNFDRAENYLSMVGLIIVILGGIAVSSVTRVFILQKIRSIAVLKCVGARSREVIAIYILQVVTLGLAGSLLGVLLARLAVGAIPLALGSSSSLLAEVNYGVTWSAAVQGVAIGVLVSLLFSIVPLLHVRFIKPSLLLRDESIKRPRDFVGMAAVAGVTVALVAVAVWQAASLEIGLVVCAGFCGLAFVLYLAGRALVSVITPLANTPSFPLRHAVLHLSRPGNQTRVILLAVGLGAFFIVGIRSLQSSLLEEFSIQVSADSPDMFLLDIQNDQANGVQAFLAQRAINGTETQLLPVLRARVVGTGRREYTVTYRDHLESNERILDGAFWDGPGTEPEVSIEEGIRERLEFTVGDTIPFDILGRVVHARVTSVREVEWRDSRNGGFMFVFRPGSLDWRAADVHRAGQGPEQSRGPGPVSARPRGTVPERLGDRFLHDSRHGPGHHGQGHAGDHRGRRPGALQRRADPRGSRRDDKVSARLRGSGLQDARREHRHDRADAAGRVQRARCTGRARRIGRSDRAHLGRQPLCARDPLAGVARRARHRCHRDRGARRGGRCVFEPGRASQQTPLDAAGGIDSWLRASGFRPRPGTSANAESPGL